MEHDDIEDPEEEETPDYYICSCCGHTQIRPGIGNGCDFCGLFNVMVEY